MRYVLNTNIISDLAKTTRSPSLLAWMANQDDSDLFIASLTVAEISRGILQAPSGKRRTALETWFAGPAGSQRLFAERILPFDEKAALVWARMMADARAQGRPRSGLDTIIAAMAVSWRLTTQETSLAST